jgi:hypothetical protein
LVADLVVHICLLVCFAYAAAAATFLVDFSEVEEAALATWEEHCYTIVEGDREVACR